MRACFGFGSLVVVSLVVGCGGSTFTAERDASGGASGSGGVGTGGSGGVGTGGAGTGGTETGGATGTGGSGGTTGGDGGSGGTGTGGGAGDGTGGSGAAGSGGTGGIGTGGTAGEGTGGNGPAGSGGTGGVAGTAGNSGDCIENTQCGELGECVELAPGGFRVCTQPVEEATACNPDGTFGDECCDSSECSEGTCLETPLVPFCGGMMPMPVNVCATDECTSTEDCAAVNSVCVPAGVWGHKIGTCVTGGCVFDSDCDERPGGTCQPVEDPCCYAPAGLYCVYPGGCSSHADCPPEHSCIVSGGQGVCTPEMIACPA